jgi:hypothetical protein
MATLKYKDAQGNWQPLIAEIPTKVSQLDNDLNFLQSSILPLSIANGGFGGTSVEQALQNLGIEDRLKALEDAMDILVNNDGSSTMTFLSSTTYIKSSNRTFSCYRRGKLVTYRIRFSKAAAQAKSTSGTDDFVKIGTIPTGFRPLANSYVTIPIQTSTREVVLRLQSDGEVYMYSTSSEDGWVNGTITVPIAASNL